MPNDGKLPSKYVADGKTLQWEPLFPRGILERHSTDEIALLVRGIPPLYLVQFF